MRTFGWRVVAIGAVLLAVSLGFGAGEDDARRVSTKGGFPGPDEHQVPTEWGQPIAIASSAINGLNTKVLFQAEDGTLRLVVLSGKKSWLEQVMYRTSDDN